jgi:hypothetical protein
MNDIDLPTAWPSGTTGWRISGWYRRSPLAGSYCAAELECVPMTRAHEYAQGALMEQPAQAPVLVSPSQRYRILADLVCGLRANVPGLGCLLVRVYGPDFNVPLPADLLAADVLLVHDPLAALPVVLSARATNIALIDHDLRADGPERGSNRMSVALLQPDPAETVAPIFAHWVRSNPMLQALSRTRFESIDARPA